MDNGMLLAAVVAVPVLGAFLLPAVGRVSATARNVLSVGLVGAALLGSAALLPGALAGEQTVLSWGFGQGSVTLFRADALAVFMALVSALVSTIIVVYSTGYISHYSCQNEYYFLVVLFLGAMMGLVFAGNLIVLYVFWEITAITSWRLIGFFREPAHVLRADKAFLVTMAGGLAMLVGFILLYAQAGTFDLAVLRVAYHAEPVPGIVVALILAGILSKSATLPLHTWLPDAGVAPSPVTALLHAAVLVKIGVYVFARLFLATLPLSPEWVLVVQVVAAASALISAAAALIDTDLKRIIAYSTVSQIAFIFLGFASWTAGSGVAATAAIGVAGALLYILMHGLAKAGLFLCAGIVEQTTHTKDITQLGGLYRTMPVTAVSFLLCAFSVMGVPPLGGFFSKYMVMSGAVQGAPLWITLSFLAGAFLTLLYLLRVFNAVFLGEGTWGEVKEGSPVMLLSVAGLAALSLAAGLLVHWPAGFAQEATRQMLSMVR
jgi:NADH:ubiquinone oxidoreductase subunit 5 (subunit L)/multisubunit Na+/H+ antiporter MnhA subunit